MEITKEHIGILDHAEKHGLFCGDSKEMRELCEVKMMEFAGRKSFVPDPYFRIMADGKLALKDLRQLNTDKG